MTGAFIVLSTIGLLTVALSYLSFKFRRLRPLLDGEPIILLDDGHVLERNMSRERLTVEDLAQEARLQGLDSLSAVRWAVLEASGEISIVPKER